MGYQPLRGDEPDWSFADVLWETRDSGNQEGEVALTLGRARLSASLSTARSPT